MPSISDAYGEPPRVVFFEGDIVLSGPGCNAAYTVDAARALRGALDALIRQSDADPEAH
ncbi:MAG: hypothetical protein ACK4VY_06665 [Brevundimonas sp.]